MTSFPALKPNASRSPLPPWEHLPILAFPLRGQVMAVPLAAVVKLVNCPVSLQTDENEVGLLPWGDHQITVLNLYTRLATSSEAATSPRRPFLLILQAPHQDLYGIPVTEPPALLNLPASSIRPLPQAYRQAMPLPLASYVAVLPRGEISVTLLLLDLSLLLHHFLGAGQDQVALVSGKHH
ncbi:MAG: hypothetical protein HC921_17645 [Synechococcaceae cyanobacterium SM2_3_1]|nr:hypothetical protein [Synechococcaceae cyanobacterium SM2_3_1]